MGAAMLRRLAGVVLWLFAGHLALGGLYWALLNVPESNVLALATSALLALVIVVGAGIVEVTGLLWLRPEWRWRAALARSLRVLPAFILALLLWCVVNWIVGAIETRYEARTGELDAWLIAKFNWTRTAWLHRLIPLLFAAVRYVIGFSLAVSLVAFAAAGRFIDVLRLRWLLRALSPGQLVIIGVAVAGLMWLPWNYVYWRPEAIPANRAELLFIGAKLAALGLLVHLGWALVLWAPHASAKDPGGPSGPSGPEAVGVRVPVPSKPAAPATHATPLE
jgi:hypothetical protein